MRAFVSRQDQWPIRAAPARRAFTLVELLATAAVLAILISLILPAVRGTLGVARAMVCQRNLGTVVFDFAVFADPRLHESRGMDSRYLRDQFYLLTFMNSQYRVGEFWEHGAGAVVAPMSKDSPMRCPAGPAEQSIVEGAGCNAGGLSRPQNVSIGFNRRLHQPDPLNRRVPQFALRSRIAGETHVPLLWDSDGEAAFPRVELETVFSAPSLDSRGLLAGDRYWSPGRRHGGRMNVGFIGGHVLSTESPLAQASWKWGYQPGR